MAIYYCKECCEWVTEENTEEVEVVKSSMNGPAEYEVYCKGCGGTLDDEPMDLEEDVVCDIFNELGHIG